MAPESIVRELVERVWNGGDLDRLEDFFAETFDHGGRPDNPAGLRAWHEQDALIWAEQRFEIVSLVGEIVPVGDEIVSLGGEGGGDGTGQVALRWRATARHIGQWGPVPATGKTIGWDGVHFFTLRDGKVVAMWAMADVFGKALQLGAVLGPPA